MPSLPSFIARICFNRPEYSRPSRITQAVWGLDALFELPGNANMITTQGDRSSIEGSPYPQDPSRKSNRRHPYTLLPPLRRPQTWHHYYLRLISLYLRRTINTNLKRRAKPVAVCSYHERKLHGPSLRLVFCAFYLPCSSHLNQTASFPHHDTTLSSLG